MLTRLSGWIADSCVAVDYWQNRCGNRGLPWSDRQSNAMYILAQGSHSGDRGSRESCPGAAVSQGSGSWSAERGVLQYPHLLIQLHDQGDFLLSRPDVTVICH